MKIYRDRKPTRLSGYDYTSPGAYFVTICTYQREYLFGEIIEGEMQLNEPGEIVKKSWFGLQRLYPSVLVDHFVVMPNHVHGLVEIQETQEKTKIGLLEIVGSFKSRSARLVNTIQNTPGVPLWQRSFYDMIIRDEKQLQAVMDYILLNPQRWGDDEDNIINGERN